MRSPFIPFITQRPEVTRKFIVFLIDYIDDKNKKTPVA